ncbi:MAG TPA: M20 family metallopeptidase [Candidatus Saccharimonadales bacterium]|nr:M20 family metallopeptidase [Candidatus Saccharimonadales bacterium]
MKITEPLVEQLLRELVAMPTVTADTECNERALNFIASFLKERGMHVYQAKHDGYASLVATTQKTKTPKVMLVGHTDVVPAEEDFFKVEEQGDKLYGRGTRDMKGAIAAYMTVVDILQRQLDDYDFGIMVISDEETVDYGVIRLLKEGYRPKSVVLLDGGESWHLEQLAKGALYMSIAVNGKTAHGSRPWQGDSASFKLVELLAEFQQDFVGHGPETDTLNVSNIRAGSGAFNQIPDSATALLDIRLIDESHKAPVKARLEELCRKYDGSVEEIVYFPVLKHNMDNPYLVSFRDSITKVTGVEYSPTIAYGASDACRFDELGIPCAVTYPVSGGHHSATEWISKKALHDLVLILADHLEKTAKAGSQGTAKRSAVELAAA